MCARFAVNSRFPSMKMIGVEHLDLGIVWDGAGVGGVSFGRAFDSEGIKSSCSSVKKPSTREMSSIEATRRFNIAKESSSRMTFSVMLNASYATSPEGLPRAPEASNSKIGSSLGNPSILSPRGKRARRRQNLASGGNLPMNVRPSRKKSRKARFVPLGLGGRCCQ